LSDLTIILGLLLIGLLVYRFYLLWAEDEPHELRRPDVKYLVVAGSYAEASVHMENEPRWSWRYVTSARELCGYRPGDVEVRLVGQWARASIWNDGFAVHQLQLLGVQVVDPYQHT
jgi:hypothetical protein